MRSKGKRAERRKTERTPRGGPAVPAPKETKPFTVPPHIRELAEQLKLQRPSSR